MYIIDCYPNLSQHISHRVSYLPYFAIPSRRCKYIRRQKGTPDPHKLAPNSYFKGTRLTRNCLEMAA